MQNIRVRHIILIALCWSGNPNLVLAEGLVAVQSLNSDIKNLIIEVVKQHPSVIAAENNLRSAQADIETAEWQFYPTPSASVEKASSKSNLNANSQTTYLRLQQPLWTGGRLSSQLDHATAAELVSRAYISELRQGLAIRVLQAWADAQAAYLKRIAYRSSEAEHLDYVEMVQHRVAEGLSPKTDVDLSKSRLDAIKSDLEQAEIQLDLAVSKLEQLCGHSLSKEALFTEFTQLQTATTAYGQNLDITDSIKSAIKVNPVIRKLKYQLAVQNAEIGVAKSKYWPDIYARAEHSIGDVTPTQDLVYVGLSTNFGAGLSTMAGVNSAESKLDAKLGEIDAEKRNLIDQIRADSLLIKAGERRIPLLNQSVELAIEVSASYSRQFEQGRKTWQDLMNAVRERAQTQAQLADACSAYWFASNRLSLLSRGLKSYLAL